jgi:uncharacterized membrane protein
MWLATMIYLAAAAAPEPPAALPPPVQAVLAELELSNERREAVRDTLLRHRQERRELGEPLRARHEQELAALLTPDQLVALRRAMPPPRHRGECGPRR